MGKVFNLILNLLNIIISLLLFTITYTRFEKIVVALLLIIYLQISSFYSNNNKLYLLSGVGTAQEFLKIRKLLKDPITEEEEKNIQLANDLIKKESYYFWVNAIANFIVYLIAAFNILSAILNP